MRQPVRIAALCGLVLCVAGGPIPAAAQGSGRGNASGHNRRPSTAGTASSSTSGVAGSGAEIAPGGLEGAGVRPFGSWLDDASIVSPGSAYASFAVSYWRLPGFTEVDVPAIDLGVGLARRIQVGASLPVYHASEPGGPIARGLGDLQFSSKIQLRDPAAGTGHQIGLAVTPMIEVASATPPGGAGRLSWALPLSIELRHNGWRTYGSAGYFSRGAVFASGALEVSIAERAWLTGAISQSRSIKRDDLSEALGLATLRTDLSGAATVLVSDGLAVFGSLGRTLSRTDPNRANLFLIGGVSLNFVAWTR